MFFLSRPDSWNQDFSPLGCALGEELGKPRIALEIAAKLAFGDDPANYGSYEKWSNLNRRRAALIQELGRIDQEISDRDSADLDQALFNRRKTLTMELGRSEDEYRQLVGKVMLIEREIYEELYRSLKSQLTIGNACRDFIL
jgi:hypothetical protein